MGKDNAVSEQKSIRVLDIYTQLIYGEVVNKSKEAERFGKTNLTIQSDIDAVRAFFAEKSAMGEPDREVVYDKKLNGYCFLTMDLASLILRKYCAVPRLCEIIFAVSERGN